MTAMVGKRPLIPVHEHTDVEHDDDQQHQGDGVKMQPRLLIDGSWQSQPMAEMGGKQTFNST